MVKEKHHVLEVSNFGPITSCTVKLNDLMIFIGPQSSGKSTISKLFFFFLNIRDEFINFVLDGVSAENPNGKIQIRDFSKITRKRFLEFWGPAPQAANLSIKYYYSPNVWIEIKLDSAKHKFTDTVFSRSIIDQLSNCYKNIQTAYGRDPVASNLFSTSKSISSDRAKDELVTDLINTAKKLFAFNQDLLFIPAGRSLLSTLSDQLQFIHPHQLDYPMRRFIERINKAKPFFGKSITEIINEKRLLGEKEVWYSAVRKAETYIKRILKGEYIHDKDGGKLYVNKNNYTKINFASSGQQESIWILLSLFLVALEKIDALIFIEEPEAHLFPVAQKEIVELIAFLANSLKTKFIITSHSPYVLGAVNNLIYASEVGKRHHADISKITPANTWLNFEKINGYYINSGELTNLRDEELRMLKTELIDSASELSNEEYDAIFKVDTKDNQ